MKYAKRQKKKTTLHNFNLLSYHVGAPLGRRNWELELGPESRLFKRVVAKRTQNCFR